MAERKYKDTAYTEVLREFNIREKRVEILNFLEMYPFLTSLLLEAGVPMSFEWSEYLGYESLFDRPDFLCQITLRWAKYVLSGLKDLS